MSLSSISFCPAFTFFASFLQALMLTHQGTLQDTLNAFFFCILQNTLNGSLFWILQDTLNGCFFSFLFQLLLILVLFGINLSCEHGVRIS